LAERLHTSTSSVSRKVREERLKMESDNDESLFKTLSFETMRIYKYFLKKNPHEVTLDELAKTFSLAKSTILHHIEKLKRVDLIEQTMTGYKIKEMVKISIIKGYSNIVQQSLKEWLPITILCFIWLFVSLAATIPAEAKAIFAVTSVIGISYSLWKVWKTV